ncbi:DUF4440 domain-containing protein [Tritonibacter scottomollicae]|uniref:DUF4440 domain-containing protein n=1 Tax=Tritonibacter scottomollicae TaxID=483013 RepID=UPI003AA8BD61
MGALQDPDVLLQELSACERAVWDALVRGDADADAALLCESFLGVYSSGFADRADHSAQLHHGPTVEAYDLTELQARALGAGHGLLSYRASFQRTGRQSPEVMFVSSIWQRRGAGWINIFSQDTPALPETHDGIQRASSEPTPN